MFAMAREFAKEKMLPHAAAWEEDKVGFISSVGAMVLCPQVQQCCGTALPPPAPMQPTANNRSVEGGQGRMQKGQYMQATVELQPEGVDVVASRAAHQHLPACCTHTLSDTHHLPTCPLHFTPPLS